MDGEEPRLEIFERHRERLFSIAYGMLGEVASAEDAVQEAFLRWQALTEEQLVEVRSPEDYLSTVIVRLSIDRLRSAQRRREEYVGPWLPEPLLTEPAPEGAEAVAAEESLNAAVSVMLESLTPVERTVFLLREVFGYGYDEIAPVVSKEEANCRQIARRAKAAVAARRPRFEPSVQEQKRLVQSFVEAASEGEMGKLLSLLAEDVRLYSDGGGQVPAARNPVAGSERVARFVLGIVRKARRRERAEEVAPLSMRRAEVNGLPGLIGYSGGQPAGVLTLEVSGGLIRAVRIIVNPDKLRHIPRLGENRRAKPPTIP